MHRDKLHPKAFRPRRLGRSAGRGARIGFALCAVALLSLPGVASARSPAQDGGWSQPYRLSSDAGKASEAYCAADPYGLLHCFWTETLYADDRSIIQYARFDGETWTASIEIYVTGRGIENLSIDLDRDATLHLAWTEGLRGPAYSMHAPAHNALSSRNWSRPRRIGIPAGIVRVRVDASGTQHAVYVNRVEELGVFYVRSKDGGLSWTAPVWLDPDIPPAYTPQSLNFELDETGGLHAVWTYGALVAGAPPREAVRYIHSLDGGETWSTPFVIDQAAEGSDHRLAFAGPRMVVQGQTVHVVWAAGELPYRHHRFSTDAGRTWSPVRRIFGDLHGQAGDGLAVDGAGRVHFVGQIRYPQGIYHAVWDLARWTPASLIYTVAEESSAEGMRDRVHAHDTRPFVRAGNQLVVTFADPPADSNRRLFVMYRTLDDLVPLEPLPTPTSNPTPAPSPRPASPQSTPVPAIEATGQPVGVVPGPDAALRAALLPALLLLGGAAAIRARDRLKH